jgi:hypothetical protein
MAPSNFFTISTGDTALFGMWAIARDGQTYSGDNSHSLEGVTVTENGGITTLFFLLRLMISRLFLNLASRYLWYGREGKVCKFAIFLKFG